MQTVDIHTHLFPMSAREAAAGGGSWTGSGVEINELGQPTVTTGSRRRTIAAVGHLQSLADRVAMMDRLGVDVQVLSLLPPLFGYDLEPPDAVARSRMVNDEIARHIVDWPGRFMGLATLPLRDPAAAVAEIDRMMAVRGFVGIVVGTHMAGRTWDDSELLPVLEAAQAAGALVFIHPADVRGTDLLFPRYYTHNGIGNPLETTTAAAALIFGGVLDRLPDLAVCLAHGGGYLAMAEARWDHVRREWPAAADTSAQLPSDYLQRFLVDALVHRERTVRFLVDTVGIDRVVLGSDYPADMGPRDPVGELRSNPLLNDEEKAAILGGNLARELRGHVS